MPLNGTKLGEIEGWYAFISGSQIFFLHKCQQNENRGGQFLWRKYCRYCGEVFPKIIKNAFELVGRFKGIKIEDRPSNWKEFSGMQFELSEDNNRSNRNN